MSKVKRLFIDIETCPIIAYTWAIGRKVSLDHNNILENARIICVAYKWEGRPVKSVKWNDQQSDREMLPEIAKLIEEADEVIAHNGDRFDVPWLRTRCLFHRIPFPTQPVSDDTLKRSRSKFRFASNRLDYIGGYLGLGGKIKTDYSLWKRVMAKDEKALADMVNYCRRDVELLEKVWTTIFPYVKPKTHNGVAAGNDRISCPHCGSPHTHAFGNRATSAGVTQKRMDCTDCGKKFTVAETVYLRALKERKLNELAYIDTRSK